MVGNHIVLPHPGQALSHVTEDRQLHGSTHSTVANIMGYYNKDIPSYALPPPLKWGKQMESQALKRYKKLQSTVHHKLTGTNTGLWISTSYPYLAASPDGLIDYECCEPGVIEIKCPYTLRLYNSPTCEV